MVKVEHGIEDQDITAHGFTAPHGVVGKENHVTPAVGHIDDGGLFGDFIAAGDHAAEEQIFFRGKAQNHARLLVLRDRKSTRLNSSHTVISYAVFCLKKKKKYQLILVYDETSR